MKHKYKLSVGYFFWKVKVELLLVSLHIYVLDLTQL